MKIVVNKVLVKITLIVILFCIVITAGVFLVFQKTINERISIDEKYQSMEEHCVKTTEFGKATFDCIAIINWYEANIDGQNCFHMSLIEDASLYEYTLCEDSDAIKWDSKIMISEKKIPVYIKSVFSPQYVVFGSYKRDSVEFSLISDSEIGPLLHTLAEHGIQIENIRIQEYENLLAKVFYPTNGVKIENEEKIGGVILFSFNILEVWSEKGNVYIRLEMIKDEKSYETIISANSFLLADNSYSFEEVNAENFQKFDLLGEKQLVFYYLKSDTELTNEEVENFCIGEKSLKEIKNLCNKVKTTNVQELIVEDISKYMEEQLTNAEKGIVDFSKLILALIIPR